MSEHALLSASSAKRWLECTPSPRFEEQFTESSSDFAAEGTFAHSYAEAKLSMYFKITKKSVCTAEIARLQKSEYYSQDLNDYIAQYSDIIIERYNEAKSRSKDAIILLEQRLDFSQWVPEGFGTGDIIIIADGTLEVIDLKYGKGVPVAAENNPQLRLYGLGAYNAFGMLYDIDNVIMTIVQPRLDSVTTDAIAVDKLIAWGDEYVKPRADIAILGEGDFIPGEHCRFCKGKAVCRARAELNLKLASYEFRQPNVLEVEEIADILGKLDRLTSWADDVKTYSLEQAEKNGVKFPGYKLVEGRSTRKYSDQDVVADTLIKAGYVEALLYERSLLGITAMEKLIGKKKFEETLGELIIKPAGKPTLVVEADKRPEIQSINSAKADFAETDK